MLPLEFKIFPYGYNKFIVDVFPFERGMGITIANCMRRILLSSIPGLCIVGIKIDGIKHEIDNLNGVKEDVISISLNIKQLIFKIDKKIKTPLKLVLVSDKQGVVTGKNVILINNIQILNPNQYICYLEGNYKLRIEMFLIMNKGFIPAYKISKLFKNNLRGFITIDSFFSPIKRVSYKITESVFNNKNYDRINMIIETDGSISIPKALKISCLTLISNILKFDSYE